MNHNVVYLCPYCNYEHEVVAAPYQICSNCNETFDYNDLIVNQVEVHPFYNKLNVKKYLKKQA